MAITGLLPTGPWRGWTTPAPHPHLGAVGKGAAVTCVFISLGVLIQACNRRVVFCQEPPGGWEGGAGARGVAPMLSAAPVTVQRVFRGPELPSLSADDVGSLL